MKGRLGVTTTLIEQLGKSLMLDFFGPLFFRTHRSTYEHVIIVKEQETYQAEIKCHKMLLKSTKSLKFEGLISWGHSRTPRGTNLFLL